jgi:NAD(P)-dependent dehydrogenase (short-subunit alcohol dehydrogenase family)
MNLSSIGGLHGYPSNGVYYSIKLALEGPTQVLATDLAPFGVQAVIVEPG